MVAIIITIIQYKICTCDLVELSLLITIMVLLYVDIVNK